MEQDIKITDEQNNKVRKYLSVMGYDRKRIEEIISGRAVNYFLEIIETYEKSILSQGYDDPFQFFQNNQNDNLSHNGLGGR